MPDPVRQALQATQKLINHRCPYAAGDYGKYLGDKLHFAAGKPLQFNGAKWVENDLYHWLVLS